FVWEGYALDCPGRVKTIIDAGANIGLSAVYLARRFPDATVVAIEPEEGNFPLLQRNSAAYANIIPRRAALWAADTMIGLSNPDARSDSFRFNDGGSTQMISAISIPSLLEAFGIDTLDVLKMDIEGAEEGVFAASAPWIGRVR